MSILLDRDMVIHGVVAVGACVAAWMFAVKPQHEQLKALQGTIARTQDASAGDVGPTRSSLQMQASAINTRVAEIVALNAWTNDASQVYGRVMTLAHQHNVRIQGMQPDSSSTVSSGGQATVSRIKINAEGGYADVARFMEGVCELSPLMRPNAAQISPTIVDNEPVVSMALVMEALNFKIADALSPAGDTPHGQP